MLIGFGGGVHAIRSQDEMFKSLLGEHGVGLPACSLSKMILKQTVDEIDIGANKFFRPHDILHEVITMMSYEFQIQCWDGAAGLTCASGSAMRGFAFVAERNVSGFDQFKERLAAWDFILSGISKDRVTFDFMDDQLRLEMYDDDFEQFTQNILRMFQFRSRDKRGIT